MAVSTSAKIVYSTVLSQSFANLFNLINTRSNVVDPIDSTGVRKFVYSKMPDVSNRNFSGFPFIVVSRSSPDRKRLSVDGRVSDMLYEFSIIVYSKNRGTDSSGDPQGAEYADSIANDIFETLSDEGNKRTLRGYGLGRVEFDVDNDYDDLDGKTVFMTEFVVRFLNVLVTSQ